jgi:protein-S-isoprenylcysteine O-methyltransferase Ste14
VRKEQAVAEQSDRAGVIFPPPLVALLALVAAIALDHFWPLPTAPRALALALGAALSVFGIGIAAWGRITLMKSGTNVNPYKPTSSIVSSGPFRFTRNPLYVGLQSLFIGLSLLAGTWWGVVLLVPVFLVLHYGVVLREEAYLERKFGKPYLSYKSNVRRWL